jgi:hypothetical protein
MKIGIDDTIKRTIKIAWLDTWWGDENKEFCKTTRVYKLLAKHYNLELSDNPDYIIDGGQSLKYMSNKYDRAIKILVNGENYVPDFNFFDYAVGFDHLKFEDRFTRQPWFAFYDEFYKMSTRDQNMPSDGELLNREFCSFVVTNSSGADPFRTEFFNELSKYKRVASGGRYLNNVGGPVANKCDFCSRYKFNIAIENSVSPGYTTEKLMEPLTVYSVPIYYGNPTVEEDFYTDCMVRISSSDDIKRAIEEIIALDKDDDAYLKKVKARCLVHPVEWWDRQLEDFLVHVIEQPFEKARRLIPYGYQRTTRYRMDRLYRMGKIWDSVSMKFPIISKTMKWLGS